MEMDAFDTVLNSDNQSSARQSIIICMCHRLQSYVEYIWKEKQDYISGFNLQYKHKPLTT